MSRGSVYLQVPQPYCLAFGNLRWAADGSAVEFADGETFALREEIGWFFEGFASQRRPIHFGFVLHLLYLLGYGKTRQSTQPWELWNAFSKTGRPLRNAGVLCARLCEHVPPSALPLDIHAVRRRLASGPLMAELCVRWSAGRESETAELPPLDPAQFEKLIVDAFRAFSEVEIDHWLRHGRDPLPAVGEKIAQEIEVQKPRPLSEAFEILSKRPRLAGAIPFVDQLVSALTLPPRRLMHEELPLGGYADVTTRGSPERLLPSQFAVDGLEFVRRFAENELLYFRREEPQAQVREELVVVLDQGVRTWGDVRLALTAAVVAFGKLAVRRKLRFRIAATSTSGRLVDPLEVSDAELGNVLEASDLTAHPGLALERVLEEHPEELRDVVLLTHPRSLAEADVAAAARRVPSGTRLFAVAVDGHGTVDFSELKHGTPVPRSRFQVDLTLPSRRKPPAISPEEDEVTSGAWTGDVEPIGFPFRFGIVGKVAAECIAFDVPGQCLLTVSTARGMLHVWWLTGHRWEVLPRGFYRRKLLNHVECVRGVNDGFVVIGKIDDQHIVFHYNLTERVVTAHVFGPHINSNWQWYYFHIFIHWLRGTGRFAAPSISLPKESFLHIPPRRR